MFVRHGLTSRTLWSHSSYTMVPLFVNRGLTIRTALSHCSYGMVSLFVRYCLIARTSRSRKPMACRIDSPVVIHLDV